MAATPLKSMPDHFRFLRKAFNELDSPVDPQMLDPSSTAFANMQRMVAKYLEPSDAIRQRMYNQLSDAAETLLEEEGSKPAT